MDAELRSIVPAFIAIGSRPDVASAVCAAVANGSWAGQSSVAAICSAAHLPQSRQADVTAVLRAGAGYALFQQHSPLTWSPNANTSLISRMAWMLEGAATYLHTIHRDADDVEVVVTKPARPSCLELALREAGYEAIGSIATTEMFTAMAVGAQSSFTVMTPFLDEHGAETLVELFRKTAADVMRTLVIRSTPTGLPDAYASARTAIDELGVRVLDYRIEREGGGYETFHAKVVLSDSRWAYVGSANMNQWSLAYSMELGVSLRGRSAARIARIIDAISRVARPMSA